MKNAPGRRPFGILAIDVDGLKKVNDTKGHDAGDAFSAQIAKTLSKALRREDSIPRIGGDEFVTFLFDPGEDAGRRVTERMLDALKHAPFDGEVPRVSLGLGCGPRNADVTELQRAADLAIYSARRRGGAQYVVAGSVEFKRCRSQVSRHTVMPGVPLGHVPTVASFTHVLKVTLKSVKSNLVTVGVAQSSAP